MKQKSPRPLNPPRAMRWLMLSALLAILILPFSFAQFWNADDLFRYTAAGIPSEEASRYPDYSRPAELEWAQFSIQNPQDASDALEALKTADERALDEWKRLAILNPEGYRTAWAAAFGKEPHIDEAAAAAREKALRAILNPWTATAEKEQSKSAEHRNRDALAMQAILFPQEFNAQVNQLKSAAQFEAEARARLALEDPDAFNESLWQASGLFENPRPTTEN